jgi:hypothetical protein
MFANWRVLSMKTVIRGVLLALVFVMTIIRGGVGGPGQPAMNLTSPLERFSAPG